MSEEIEYDINIYGNLMIIDNKKQNIKVIEVPSIKKLFNEKQQLIKFLEDKIKEHDEKIKNNNYKGSTIVERYEEIIKAYQEVLDFVNKGGKE